MIAMSEPLPYDAPQFRNVRHPAARRAVERLPGA
jgi:hypothetical protein